MRRTLLNSWLLIILVFIPMGCAHDYIMFGEDTKVVPLINDDVAVLSADDIALVMRRAGFTDELIIEFGPDLRNCLAEAGAAQIRVEKRIQAVFAVKRDYLHVSSLRKGNFTYDLVSKQFK